MDSPAPKNALAPGTILGKRWRIQQRIGGGGMGTVYQADHLDLGGRVAIKVLHPLLRGDRVQVERFRREAETAAKLAHPNIVDVIDFGDAADGPLYIVMEYLDGPSLREVSTQPTPVARIGNIALQVLAALEAAHHAKIVHRDLKPANVVVVAGEDGDLAKLIDFGVARLTEGTGYRKLTRTGTVLGTPSYMPPEQARGETLDHRVDLYALGAVLYRLFGGRPPFAGTALGDLLPQICRDDPAPLAGLHPGLPASLIAVVERAMRKERGDRFPDAAAMAGALRAALDEIDPLDDLRSSSRDIVPIPSVVPPPPDDPTPVTFDPRARRGGGELDPMDTIVANRWRLSSMIGRGRSGTVYEAMHVRTGQLGALKLLDRSLVSSRRHVARFLREARTASAFDHPGIVRVLDSGDSGRRRNVFIVFELLDGADLAHTLGSDPLPLELALHVTSRLLEALAAAHARAMVHRDIRPENVRLIPGDDVLRPTVKLRGFGLAKHLLWRPDHGAGTTTGPGGATTGGTGGWARLAHPYLSPEQCRDGDVDARADLYAVGALAYRLLTGKPPFDPDPAGDLPSRIVLGRAPSLALARPDLPATVVRVVDRALDPNPAARWPSAQQMSDELTGRGAPISSLDWDDDV